MLYIILKYLIGPLFWLFCRPIIYGRQNLRISGKAILICNHQSMLDPIILAFITPRPIHFMAKKELFDGLLGKLFLKALYVFPVNRKNVDLQSLKSALSVLEKNKIFGIFPEGKRSITPNLDEFEKGAAFLAIRSGAPVVPIYMQPPVGKIRPIMMVGKPIDINAIVANSNKVAMVDVVADELADAIDALKTELGEIYWKF